MKEICKNCACAQPSYKKTICGKTGKTTKQQATCENWRPKK